MTGIALGFVIGLLLGLLGGGGSILAVPAFVYLLGYGVKEAIPMSLAVVGMTSLLGALGHVKDGSINVRVALIFGAVATLGSYVGTRFASRLSGPQQLTIFAAVMIAAGVVMLRDRRIAPAPYALRSRVFAVVVAVEGLAVGMLTGLVGVGGGFLIVPALVSGGLPMCDAVGTSLLVIGMNCAMGLYGHAEHVPVNWLPVGLVMAGAVPGMVTGTYAMRLSSQKTLRRGFAALLFAVAGFITVQVIAG